MATITHPFHPLSGQNFRILKTRVVAGEETIVLEGTSHGTFAVLREWTDQAPLRRYVTTGKTLILDFQCLLELAQLIESTNLTNKGVDQ